ncbi:MAG: Ig-like domain-containing protein, partial [Eubacteriales bacterium]|nr:Ig-like domain-containing protein [Eubacteriales bacterium]
QTGGARARNNKTNPNCLWFSMPASLASDRKWYDVEFVINLDTDDATIKICPEGSNTAVHTDSKKYYAGLGVFEFAQDISSAGSAYAARIDDIVFYNVYDSEPEFTEANIKLYAGDVMQADFYKISKFTDKIVISFPQKIKAETLLASNIYLTDENGATVATGSQVVDGIECTLTLSETLAVDGTYTLHIKDLKNTSGYVMSGEFTQDFVVESATVVSGLKNIMIGSEEVVSLSQLTAGSEVTVNYSVENTTDTKQDATIIIAFYYYENDIPVLVSCDVIPGEVAANTKADNLSQTFTVPNDTFNNMVVMLWDDVERMKPLTSTIEINN